MATDKPYNFELNTLERQWIAQALKTQHETLRRKRATEVPGSEIYQLRGKELEAVNNLIKRIQ